ncbi:MAG: hypothetical protein ACHQ1D_06020 [Nitrososphaerales archaeon]
MFVAIIVYNNNNNHFYFLLPDIRLPNPLSPPPTALLRFDRTPPPTFETLPATFVILPVVAPLAFVILPVVAPLAFVILPVVLLPVAAYGAAGVP